MNNLYFSRKVTLSRYKYYFCVKFFDGGKWKKKISSLIFWKRGTGNEFYGTIDISFQMKGTEFSVIHGLEKAKLLHTGTCTSTCTRHVN